MISRSVLIAAALFATAFFPQLAIGQATVEIPDDLVAVREGLAKAYNSGDLDLLLSFCHDDVIAIWQHGEVATGHQAVRDVVSRLTQDDNPLIIAYNADPTVEHRLFLEDGNVVVSSGKLNDRYTIARPQGAEVQLHSNWTATLVKTDDRWLVVSFHVSTNAFDNEVITLYGKLTRWTTGAVAGGIGLALGAVSAILIGRSRRGAARVS